MWLFACTCVIISLYVNVLVQFWVLAIKYWQQCVRVPLMHYNLQGNVPAIKLALGVAILTHCTSFLANNVSTALARYSLKSPVNLLSASWFVSELTCQRVGLSARCLWSYPNYSEFAVYQAEAETCDTVLAKISTVRLRVSFLNFHCKKTMSILNSVHFT